MPVQLSDVIIPEVYQTYSSVDSPETTLFSQSGVAVSNPLLLSAFDGGGKTAVLPFWNDLDDTTEPNYSTDNPADIATPDKVTTGEMVTRIADVNKWYSSMNLVVDLAGSDPVQHIRDRFGKWWTRQWQHRLIATCNGIMASNIAHNGGDMVVDVSTQDGAHATAANLINGSAFVNALYSMGDRADEISAIAVHSVIMAELVKNDMIQFFKPSTDSPVIPTFMGKAVIMDDSMPVVAGAVSGFRYTSILFGPGAIGYAEGAPTMAPVEVWKNPLAGNGAGEEMIGERKRWILHPFGHKWNDAVVTGEQPTLADMANPANWSRVVVRKNVPMTFLITNG